MVLRQQQTRPSSIAPTGISATDLDGAGSLATITVSFENRGDTQETYENSLLINGNQQGSLSVTLGPGELGTDSADIIIPTDDLFTASVEGTGVSATFDGDRDANGGDGGNGGGNGDGTPDISPISLSASGLNGAGSLATITVSFRNEGTGQGTDQRQILVNGSQQGTVSVTLGAGETGSDSADIVVPTDDNFIVSVSSSPLSRTFDGDRDEGGGGNGGNGGNGGEPDGELPVGLIAAGAGGVLVGIVARDSI